MVPGARGSGPAGPETGLLATPGYEDRRDVRRSVHVFARYATTALDDVPVSSGRY